jgi:phosphomannomutase
LLHQEDRSLSAIVSDYPRYSIVKDKLDLPSAPLDSVYRILRTTFPDADVDTQDGMRLSWSDRWLHVRPSGTEPIVRVIAEAPTADAAKAMILAGREAVERLTAA